MHVVVVDGGHLHFLQGAHTTLGIHDEDVDIFLAAHAVNRSASRIAAGRAENV